VQNTIYDMPFEDVVDNAAHIRVKSPPHKKLFLAAWIGVFKPNAQNI